MRSKRTPKRTLSSDPVYKSRLITRFINSLMVDGKRTKAQNILYSSLEKLNADKKEALTIFEDALKNVMPKQEVRSRRVGGATYQVPMPVRHTRAEALAIKWVVDAARASQGTSMDQRLFNELKNAQQGIGNAIKKRDDVHKMAEANRAFAHFRM